jgi:hypothetical protein
VEGTPFQDLSKTYARRINHRSHRRAVRRMKLSIEAKVAAAVAIAFAALSLGAIAQEGSEHRTAGLSQTSLQGSEISVSAQNGSDQSQLLAQY